MQPPPEAPPASAPTAVAAMCQAPCSSVQPDSRKCPGPGPGTADLHKDSMLHSSSQPLRGNLAQLPAVKAPSKAKPKPGCAEGLLAGNGSLGRKNAVQRAESVKQGLQMNRQASKKSRLAKLRQKVAGAAKLATAAHFGGLKQPRNPKPQAQPSTAIRPVKTCPTPGICTQPDQALEAVASLAEETALPPDSNMRTRPTHSVEEISSRTAAAFQQPVAAQSGKLFDTEKPLQDRTEPLISLTESQPSERGATAGTKPGKGQNAFLELARGSGSKAPDATTDSKPEASTAETISHRQEAGLLPLKRPSGVRGPSDSGRVAPAAERYGQRPAKQKLSLLQKLQRKPLPPLEEEAVFFELTPRSPKSAPTAAVKTASSFSSGTAHRPADRATSRSVHSKGQKLNAEHRRAMARVLPLSTVTGQFRVHGLAKLGPVSRPGSGSSACRMARTATGKQALGGKELWTGIHHGGVKKSLLHRRNPQLSRQKGSHAASFVKKQAGHLSTLLKRKREAVDQSTPKKGRACPLGSLANRLGYIQTPIASFLGHPSGNPCIHGRFWLKDSTDVPKKHY